MKRKFFTIALIVLLQLTASPIQALAQTAATDSSQFNATDSAELQTSSTPFLVPPSFLLPRHRIPVPLLDTQTQQQTSAAIDTPSVVGKLVKKNYRADED